jgi:hypothetical protein
MELTTLLDALELSSVYYLKLCVVSCVHCLKLCFENPVNARLRSLCCWILKAAHWALNCVMLNLMLHDMTVNANCQLSFVTLNLMLHIRCSLSW